MRKWARNIASDTSLIISVRDSCPDFTDGFQSIDSNGFWRIHTQTQKIAMQKCRNAAMQKCRNVEMQNCRFTKIYEHLRKTIKHCEDRRKSANIYESAEGQKHGHGDMINLGNAKKTFIVEMRKSINPQFCDSCPDSSDGFHPTTLKIRKEEM